MGKNPLVSVVICTYNSSKTIIEALESIKLQTYHNLEIIISDDDSMDDTVNLCENWINSNKERFCRCKVITHSPNTGTSANANRAFEAANGEWIKCIGADDKLIPDSISNFIEYINSHPQACIIFSKVEGFGNMIAANKWPWLNVRKFFDAFNARQFRIILSAQNFLPAVSVIMKKSVWQSVGGFNEKIPLLEDWPFWVDALERGYVFNFLDKVTSCYRFSESSMSQGEKTPSALYLESSNKAIKYARKSLAKIGVGYMYLYYTREVVYHISWRLDFVILMLNVVNPAYYEYLRTIRRFKIIASL